MKTAGTEKIPEFTMLATEAVGGTVALETAHASDPALNAAMVLFEAVVQVGAGAVDQPTSSSPEQMLVEHGAVVLS